jgi:acetyl-CoA C-acetyltransferase
MNIYINAGARTPIGAFQGALADQSATQLGSHAIKSALSRSSFDPDAVDEVIMGQVLTGGAGQAPARQAALGAGLSQSIPCLTINKVCGSGMKAVMLAAQAVLAGDANVVVAGGMESMSNAIYGLEKARSGYRMGNGTLLDLMIHDGLWDPYNNCHMGLCGDATAADLGFSREELDAFSAASVAKARAAQGSDFFAQEIAPISIPQRKGDPLVVSQDEGPGRAIPEKLPALKPVFSPTGTTTAGNASSINDGAAALVISNQADGAIARIVAQAQYAHETTKFTTAPAFAIEKLLVKAGLTVADIDVFEVNEAFAVVALGVARQVGIPEDRLNPNGGAVALGHPIGMSGARLLLTAAYQLQRSGGRYAIATPCIGGGEATAVLLERVYSSERTR